MIGLLVAVALAEDTIPVVAADAQTWRLPVDARRTMWADDASLTPGLGARLAVGYMHEPVVWQWEDTGETVAIVGDALGFDAVVSYTFSRVRIGADLPIYALATGVAGDGGGLGDLAVDTKLVALDPASAPLGLALDARFKLPIATTSVPLGGDGLGWEVAAVVDKTLGPVLLAANLGVRGSPGGTLGNVELSNQLAYRLGGGWAMTDAAGLSLDLAGALALADAGNTAGSPLELMLGGWYQPIGPLTLRAGVGRGLTRGYGSPSARAVLAVGYEPKFAAPAPKPAPLAVVAPPPTTNIPAVTTNVPAVTTNVPAVTTNVPAVTTAPVVVEPAAPPALAILTRDQITLYRKVSFEEGLLRPESHAVLDAVAVVLKEHPEITSVRVESHTDDRMDVEYTLYLAGLRAQEVVKYLVKQGVAEERLFAAGYGGTRPLVPGAGAEVWEANDRIEFVVTAR